MKKKNLFVMKELLDLYKSDLDGGREYLYKHMSVFAGKNKLLNIGYAAKDIYNDIFLVVDRCIQKSIDNDYEERQIYNYIRTRVRGEILNRKTKSSLEVGDHLMPQYVADEKTPLEDLNNEYLNKFIQDEVMLLSEPYKTIMILYHLVKPRKTYKQIALTLGCSEQQVISDYGKSIKFIQNSIKNEDLY